MTEMQKKMQELISQEELDRAFDARFPKEMQVKLRAAKVAVAGIGGLGSNIAVMLARSGVGHLLLVDFYHVCSPIFHNYTFSALQDKCPVTQKGTGSYNHNGMIRRLLSSL